MAAGLSLQTRRALLEHMGPAYREAPRAKKRMLLDAFTQTTGYHRTYARWLFNHREEALQTVVRHPRQPRYGPEVVDALVQAWNANNRKCSKCLMPFLPTLLDALERHGYLHLTPECKTHLLSLSAATADRLLRASRTQTIHGISTTRAGTLLKQQIPIRTFEQWNETQPGFVEADLVAHCGIDRGAGFAGGFLYTLTMTDVATGWTECLPLLYQSQETVLAAIERARSLFPFPLLGIDTDNGGEFINTLMVAYCEHEHLTFTRGRPRVKNDQCFVEEKNRTIVRQVIGSDRFVGEHALTSDNWRNSTGPCDGLVNCFQPSMKLLSKQRNGKKISFCYDPAKTPLQRLLLSGILPAVTQEKLNEEGISDPSRGLLALYQQQEKRKRILGWRRTHNDPFEGAWEQIASKEESPQAHHVSSLSGECNGPRKRQRSQTIERAVHDYLEDQRSHHRRPKTLEWHQMALGLFQRYLLSVCHLTLLSHITQTEIQGWLAFLGQQPTCRGNLRTTGTIASYLRSARAFCQWVVRHTSLKSTPFAHLPLLKAEPPLLQPLESEEWEGLLLACQPPGETDMLAERAMARNQAILWVLADTGMRVSEICGLRLSDVDQECGILTVKEKGSKQRQLPLGQNGRHALLSYLDQRRPETVEAVDQRDACEDPLFLSDSGNGQGSRERVWVPLCCAIALP